MSTIFFDETGYPEEAASLRSLRLLNEAEIVGLDLAAPAEALAVLIGRRRAGKVTAVYPILCDPLENLYGLVGASIASTADHDQREEQSAALRTDHLNVNGRRLSELGAHAQTQIDAGALALRLADVVLIGAPGERDRWNVLLTRPFRRFSLLPVPVDEPLVNVDESGVTIYAPATQEPQLAHYVMLLRRHRIDPHIICATNADAAIGTRIVVAPEWRPMRARTLAARGHHVVAPNTLRVDECDSRIFGYLPTDYRSFLSALDAARSATGGGARIPATAPSVAEAIEREAVRTLDGPPVSIIIRTFDRPELLRRAVASVASQTYRNVEIVVVNNGGNDVRDLVESAAGGRPFVYNRMPERKHISAASNVGARAVTGCYVGYLDDDDLLYADHCARTVEVLERTGVDAAFTLCVAEYAEMNGDEKRTLGFQVYIDREFSLDDLYVSNVSPIHSIVHRRDVFDRFGYFDEELPVTDDWELWLRLASRGGTFVRIDRATCEYSWRYDPARGNMTIDHQWDFVHAYRKITERYAADVQGRTTVRNAQLNLLALQERRATDAADPAKRAGIVIGSMSVSLVPVSVSAELTERQWNP
ncbi:MAG TPA: glycosyltransferase [Candidatus Baltobacteraceae bacterium]|nr:glycosyltransferase [Candidatus Baltobacteraceae bacterium]